MIPSAIRGSTSGLARMTLTFLTPRHHRAESREPRAVGMLRGLAACALAGLCLLATATDVRAQTPVTLVSNTGETTVGTGSLLGSNDFAQAFTTGPYLSGYVVTQVKLRLSGGTATTALSDVTVTIRTSNAAGRTRSSARCATPVRSAAWQAAPNSRSPHHETASC